MTASSNPLRDLRALAATVACAEDAALLRLVGMLDALPARGEADRVLDPIRPRLRTLRPLRPLRFARLLFLPLDGAIVPPARWRRGTHEIPRSAIAPVATAVEAALGPLAAAIRQEAAGASTDDGALIAALGARLWPDAAAALPEAPPPGWDGTGLTHQDFVAIQGLIQPLLAAGPALHAALRAAPGGPPAALLRTALAGPAGAGPLPLAAALATLLRRAAAPGGVLLAATEFGPVGRAVAGRMVDVALDRLPDLGSARLAEVAGMAARLFQGAADLTQCGLLDPERGRRLVGLQHAAEEACRRRIAEAAGERVTGKLTRLRGAAVVEEETIAAIEADARSIRALAQVGRGAGDPAAYDRLLRSIAEEVARLATGPRHPEGLSVVDLARVVEILDGPDAAEALLARAGTGPGGQPL